MFACYLEFNNFKLTNMRTTPTGEPKTPQSGHRLFDFKQIVNRNEVWENHTTKIGKHYIIEQPHDTCQLSHYSKHNETASLNFFKKYGLAFCEIVLNPWKTLSIFKSNSRISV